MSEGLGEWDPRVLPNRLKELIDEIIYSVAVQDNSKAIRAITDMFSDVRNPKLYKKVRKYYQNEGVEFSGDPLDDYEIVIDYLSEDLDG